MPDTLLSLKLLAKRSASFFLPHEFRCRPWVRHIQEVNMSKERWSIGLNILHPFIHRREKVKHVEMCDQQTSGFHASNAVCITQSWETHIITSFDMLLTAVQGTTMDILLCKIQ